MNKAQDSKFPKESNQDVEKERYQRPQKQKYLKPSDVITEDTVIPDMPTVLLQEPNQKNYENQLLKFKDEIQVLLKDQQAFIENTIANIKNKKSVSRESVGILKEDFEFKIKKQSDLKLALDIADKDYKLKKSDYDASYEQSEILKEKMKKSTQSADQIKKQIKELLNDIDNGKLSNKQEKDHVQEIAQLESILPYAFQNDQVQKVLKEKQALKKESQTKFFEARNAYQNLRKTIDGIKDQINEFQSMTQEEQDQVKPLIEDKKAKIQEQINLIKENKQKAIDVQNEKWQKYRDQQQLIEKIEWMKKEKKAIVGRLKQERVLQELRKKKQEEAEQRKKDQEQLEKELENDPYDENVSACNLLIEYCKKLMPKQVQVEQKTVEQNKSLIESKIQTGEWAKNNVSLVISKKDINIQENQTGGKKNKNKKKLYEEQKEVKEILNHNVEVINCFDHIKVSPPLYSTNLEQTLQLLNEKKEYFQNLPKDSKKDQKKDDQQKSQEQRQTKKQALDIQQEDQFPGL